MNGKRIVSFSAIMALGFLTCVLGVLAASFHGTELAQAAAQQSAYQLTIARNRGDFYDCMGQKLTSRGEEALAAVAPTVDAAARMNQLTSGEYQQRVMEAISGGTPFLARVPLGSQSTQGVDVFTIPDRYEENQPAANVLGYVDGRGNGASGLEKVFQSVLHLDGQLQATYSVDAVNRVIGGVEREITDTRQKAQQGVKLTLDRRIQMTAESACADVLESGAVVVMEIGTGEIRAMVSAPSLHPDDIAEDLENPDSPLLNKALSAYSVGSVFKLVSAAAALESGISPEYAYTCTGSIDVDGQHFKCFDGIAHGTVTMEEAIAESCNGYFVSLMQQVEPSDFLKMAEKLGFGQETVFTRGYSGESGVLPEENSLLIPRALANFSFGQGQLTATPVQIAAMTAAIANGGTYTEPSLVQGVFSLSDGSFSYREPSGEKYQVISEETASKLGTYMKKAVEEGTGASGKPEKMTACAKTGTAQTGQTDENGEEIVQLWYTGYFPAEAPRYAVTVLRADRSGNGKECAQVFKAIADEMESLGFLA